jgi:molybdopterin converting factor small subunit
MRESDHTLRPEDFAFQAVDTTDEPQHTSSPSLEIPVLLFAGLKEAAGAEQVLVRVPQESSTEKVSLDVLLACCCRQYPKLQPWMPYVKVAVNCEYSQQERLVGADDEIALLPPVSGGAESGGVFSRVECSPCAQSFARRDKPKR